MKSYITIRYAQKNIQISYNDVENKTEHEQNKEAPFITSYSCILSIKCAVWKNLLNSLKCHISKVKVCRSLFSQSFH